jgi:hypothetical protein
VDKRLIIDNLKENENEKRILLKLFSESDTFKVDLIESELLWSSVLVVYLCVTRDLVTQSGSRRKVNKQCALKSAPC